MRIRTTLLAILLGAGVCAQPPAEVPEPQTPTPQRNDLANMNIEDLMNIEVTTASKQAQSLSSVAAAIYVVTADDIARAGATNVPDALRMVPGVDVAQMTASMWAVSIRGLNSRFGNKLLVLVDGRSVYTPLFSGVYWDALDVDMSDIDRIEVIRGPGGALWGANAVNGIVNIITKHASTTQGGSVEAQTGTTSPVNTRVAYGGTLGEKGFFRVYARYFRIDDLELDSGQKATDGWQALRVGLRADWESSDRDTFMLTAMANSAHEGQTSAYPSFEPPYRQLRDERFPVSNWSVVGRWQHRSSTSSTQTLQLYYDRSRRLMPEIDERRDNFDVDFQSTHSLSNRWQLTWGAGYRRSADDTRGTFLVRLDPERRTTTLWSAFASNLFTLSPNVDLRVGMKAERNDYTGWEFQPSARIRWAPIENHTVWASAARAVRTPNRADNDSFIPVSAFPTDMNVPGLVTIIGDDEFKSERLTAYELGYRVRPKDNLFVDVAAFYNVYDRLRTFEPAGEPWLEMNPVPHLIIPYRYDNKLKGETAGFEVAAYYQPTPRWNLAGTYSYFAERLRYTDDSQDAFNLVGSERVGSVPRHKFSIRSSVDLGSSWRFDTNLYYVGKLQAGNIPAYARLDAQLTWSPTKDLSLTFGAINLTNLRHRESEPTLFERTTQPERNIYLRLTWRF